MGLSVAVHVSDQLGRQYTKCAKIMECRNVLLRSLQAVSDVPEV